MKYTLSCSHESSKSCVVADTEDAVVVSVVLCAVLLWMLTAACIKVGRPQIARRAIELVEQRLSKDGWPEYYDGKLGRYIGKQARKFQTWSIAGYLVAKMMLDDPSHLGMISLEEDKKMKPTLTRSASWPLPHF